MEAKNLLFIMSDEHNPKMLGCAGHDLVKTPNIDSLAARGTRFASAYTNSPICVPARASFATGLYAHQTGYWDNCLAYDGRFESWGHQLQRNGQRVESIGKLHYRAETDSTGFDAQHIPLHIKDGIGMVRGLFRGQFPDFELPRLSGGGSIVTSAGAGETAYTKYDRKIAELACEWLESAGRSPKPKPWVLYVSFVSPHYPLTVPQRYLDLYDPADMPLPKLDPSTGAIGHPWWARRGPAASGSGVTPDMTRKALAAYLALCTFVDEQIGRVLQALEDSGLQDSTRIVYASDHGENAGARGLWGKSVMYEESAGIPLILAGADVPEGKVSATPVSLIDGYPSILDAVGLQDVQPDLPGRSWFDLASRPDEPDRTVFSEYHAIGSPSGLFMLRHGHYKLSYYVGYESELYDLEADPEETVNLAADPAHQTVLDAMTAELRAMLSPEEVDARAKADQRAFVERLGGPARALEMAAGGTNYTEVPAEILATL